MNKARSNQAGYQTVLPNKGNNSAQYIPTKIYESNRQQNASQISKGSRRSNLHGQDLGGYEKISQLSQRLKNIHHFYRIRIDEQKSKNSQRNEVFMGIIEQLQKNHNDKILVLERQIQIAEQQKKQVSYVDDKMSEIKGSIDQILKQSAAYKISNQRNQKEIIIKEDIIRQKQRLLEKLKRQQIDFRNQLQSFQKANLKQNKKQRQMLQMIDNILNTQR